MGPIRHEELETILDAYEVQPKQPSIWEPTNVFAQIQTNDMAFYRCGACKLVYPAAFFASNYCPNCGRKMMMR